jgi:D-alanine transaminase/branched-chain amino acid aminotransferase
MPISGNPFYLSAMYAFVNDRFVLLKEAAIPATDLAINRGYGIFDFFKTIGGKPVFLDDHLDRFYRSADSLRLPVSLSRSGLKAVLTELMERNGLDYSGVRLTLTGGCSEDGYSIGVPNLIISQQALLPLPAAISQQGIALLLLNHQRQLPNVKTIDYLTPIWLQPRLATAGANDFLYHKDGVISECPRANVFVVLNENRIVTPKSFVLSGITRSKLLVLATPYYTIEETDITLDEITTAKEVFITSTTKGVLPVASIDGKGIGSGTQSVSSHLSHLLQKAVQDSIRD